jgi:putative copper resistance protein D
LFAAAVWIGGLVPLLLFLRDARQHNDETWAAIASHVIRRFSTLKIMSVGTLFCTGLVNSWIFVGSIEGLVRTDYGRLVLAKIVLFGVMVSVAAVIRTRATRSQVESPQRLTRNIAIEIVLGLSAFLVVGLLGTLHPTIHLVPL